MGMFDTICGEQVKCFSCELKGYSKEDKLPCAEYGYKDNIIIFPYGRITKIRMDFNDDVLIIKNSKFYEMKSMCNLTQEDFNNNDQCIDNYGNNINISSKQDLNDWFKDCIVFEADQIIGEFTTGEYWYSNEELYENFNKKWLK